MLKYETAAAILVPNAKRGTRGGMLTTNTPMRWFGQVLFTQLHLLIYVIVFVGVTYLSEFLE